jgi:hypothetical protein
VNSPLESQDVEAELQFNFLASSNGLHTAQLSLFAEETQLPESLPVYTRTCGNRTGISTKERDVGWLTATPSARVAISQNRSSGLQLASNRRVRQGDNMATGRQRQFLQT